MGSELGKIIFELIRIAFILVVFVFFELFLGSFLHLIYSKLVVNIDYGNGYGLMVQAAILILFFVLYKNELQFSGWGWSTWFIGKSRKKLSIKVSKLLIFTSIMLLILPPILSLLFH